ncbi:MAG: hypothetical protein ACK2UT_11740, partial [Candidatus Promineifilaceae bacterium]
MKKYTYLILIFVAVGIAASVLFAGPAMEAGAQQADPETAQEPIPAPWPEEPGAMPELIGGAKADRPMVFIEPQTNSNDRQSVDEITFDIWYGGAQNFGQIGNPQ